MMNRRALKAILPLVALLLLTGMITLSKTASAAVPTAVATAAPTATLPVVRAQQVIPPTSPAPAVVLTQKNHGTWVHTTSQTGSNSAQVSIAFDHTSVQALKAFAQSNTDIAKTLNIPGTTLDARITFNHPLSVDEFKKFVADNGLNVSGYSIRVTAPDGTRWTIVGTPTGSDLVSQSHLNNYVAGVQQQAPNATLNGVIDVTASFSAPRYTALQAVPGVFLIDVSRTVAKQEAIAALPATFDPKKLTIDEGPVYWYMENLGLQNFR